MDATYREKAGKQNRGYTANVIESVGDNGSIVTDYQYEKNIELVTTDLTGREAKDIAADFLFTEDGTRVVSCPAGNAPKSLTTTISVHAFILEDILYNLCVF